MTTSLRVRGRVLIASAALWGGCLYGFAGGGMPSHIRTVAILPFDNQTAEPVLAQEVGEAMREALERRLGLRIGSEANADAIVRGTILRYEPGIALAIQGGQQRPDVTRRRVQLSLNVEIFDVRENRTLWQRNGLLVDGEYEPPAEARGRELALEKLVADIVDGAQSQW